MVEQHIKSLLYDHDCVIIPDFGGLITRYVSAKINPVKHTLAPPAKKIAFNEKLVLNDGLLISTIAYRNGISQEEAQHMVASFVHQAKATLHAQNRLELADIGVFRYNAERRLEFEYIEGDNLLEASFGLPELVARPIRVEEPAVLRTLLKERQAQEPVVQKLPLRKRLRRVYNVAAGLAMGGLTVSALYLLSLQTDYNLSSLNPLMLFKAQYATAGTLTGSRYAADYVPFTADERQAAYQQFIPAFEPLSNLETLAVAADSAMLAAVDSSAVVDTVLEVKANQLVKEEVAAVAEGSKEKEPVLTISAKTGRFYIITGGYARLKNAEISREQIRKGGQDAKVLLPLPGSKLFRVSVADFATKEEAIAALVGYRKSFGETIWVLNN